MASWNDERSAGSGMFLMGALAGALVGAGVALLMAPKTGAETRQDLNSGFNTVRDAAARRYRDLADKANAKLGYTDGGADQYGTRPSSSISDSGVPGTMQS